MIFAIQCDYQIKGNLNKYVYSQMRSVSELSIAVDFITIIIKYIYFLFYCTFLIYNSNNLR